MLLRRQRTSGSVAELPRHPSSAPRLAAGGDQSLLAYLAVVGNQHVVYARKAVDEG